MSRRRSIGPGPFIALLFQDLFNAITWSAVLSAAPESVVAAELAVGAVVLDVEAAVVEVVEGLVGGAVVILLALVFNSERLRYV